MAKLGRFAKKNSLLLLVGASALIIVVFAGLPSEKNSYVPPKISQKTTPPSPIEEDPIDDAGNGVYTNYKYRFRFRYPEDIFITFENHHPERSSLESFLEAEFTDTDVSSDRYPNYTLLVFASESGNNKNVFYKDYNRQIGVPEYTPEEEEDRKLLHNNKIVDKLLVT